MWGTATAPGWVPGGEIPPACVLFLLRCGGRRGFRSMTLPVPEVRARLSVVGRGVPPHVPRGEDRPRVVVVVSFPSLPPLPRVCEYARGPVFSRCPGLLRLRLSSGGGRRPSLPPSPLARCAVSRPAGSRSPDPARSGSGIIPLSPALRLAAACVGGPLRLHTRSRAPARGRRLGTAAWSVGAVRRAGARPSRGGSAVPDGWPLPVPATRRPPPALLSRSSDVRVPPCAARSPRRCVCVCRGFPSFPSGGRRPRFSSLSSPAWVFRPPCAPLARSLPRVSASLDGRQAGPVPNRPAGRAG